MRHFLWGEGGGGERVGGEGRGRPRVGGLVGGGRALQVVRVGGQVRVLRWGALAGRGEARGRGSVLTNQRPRESQGGGLQGLPAPRGLLLGLEQTLVAPLCDRRFMGPLLLLLERGPTRPHLRAPLRPQARVHLPRAGRHAVGLLVLGVGGRYGSLGGPLCVRHGVGGRLQGWVSCNLRGPS